MRLSEAIRLGAMMKPQCFNGLFWDGGTCAVGAAADAQGYDLLRMRGSISLRTEFWNQYPLIRATEARCPECRLLIGYGGIVHLNDEHRWTRERIADWVETIENQAPRSEQTETQIETKGELTWKS